MRETPGLFAICKELERMSKKIQMAVEHCMGTDSQAEVRALLQHNREAIKIYEGKE